MKTMNICKTRHAELVSASIKTRFRNKFGMTLIIFLLLSVCSCSNLFEDKLEKHSEEQQASDITSSKPAYLVISPNDVSINSRSVYPNLEDTLSKLRDITLYGKKTSNPDGTAFSESSSSLASAGSLAALYNKQILLEKGAGFYTFELKGTIDSVYFYQKLENVEIEDAKTNTISFALQPVAGSSDVTTPFDDYGGMHIKLYYSNSVNATYTVKLTVENLTTGETVETDKALSPEQTSGVYSATNRYVEYKRWASFGTSSSAPRIATGEYRVTFKFYFGEQLLNSLPYVVHVAKGINTVYEDTIDLNEIYKITYNYNQGSTSVKLASGQTLVEKYSRKSDDIILPRYYKMASLFLGWYTANEGGELVTHIPKGSTGNITLYAHWLSLENNTPQTLYINPDAQYHYGFSEEYGLESIAAAIETLKENSQSSSKHDWTIKIKGSLSGANTIESTSAGNPSYYFRSFVKSLTLEGASGLINGVPQDILDGGFTGYDNGNDNYGTTLTIDTTVPVTIKNLKITGGYSSNDYGAGIRVIGESEVYIEDGTLITGNTSTVAAAAIGVNDAATVTMNGGSIENNTSAYQDEGGYYSGTVLVYKEYGSEVTGNPKFILNGGTIKKNKTIFYGGGVGVLSNGQFEMNGGTIGGTSDEDANIADSSDSFGYANGSSTYGGGVYVGSGGSFTMNGGVISHNKAPGIGTDPSNSGTHDNCGGGGVAVCNGGSFEMKAGTLNGVPTAGEISSNTSGRNGGGVYLDSTSTFTMKAGTISGNISTDEGKGVYLSNSGCTFKMGKSAVVNEDNDVYLPDGASITISEDFDGNITTAAVITPQTYSTQTTVLTAEGVNLENEVDVFAVTPQDEAGVITNWTINATGTLYNNSNSGYTVTRTNPEATLTPTSGTMLFEVSGLSNPEEPWNEVNVDIKYYDAGEDYWYTYDSDEGHNYSSDWDGNIFKLYLYSFSPDDQYKVVFYDSENNPLCSDYEFEFTVAELPVQTIDIGSLDSDGLTSAVQTAVEVFGSGKVKLAFTGTNSTNGVNLYNIVASALSNYQAAELDFSECSGSVVSEVPDNAFWNKFSGNGTIALSDSTTKLGSQAFAQNSTITVSNLINVTEIGEKAFYYNSTYSGLGDISLNNVTSIGNSAFGNCVIGTLYLGTSTSIEINSNAFYDSESSWNPNSTTIDVLNIGNFEGDVKTPFNKCNHIYKFEVPDTNTKYYTDSTGSKLYLKADDTEYMSTK